MKLLLTGFEPFNESNVNPSEQVVKALEKHKSEVHLYPVILPVDRLRAPQELIGYLETIRPDAVICLGEAPRRMRISIERVAINLQDYSIPDNAGNLVSDEPIVPGGPAAYFVTLPVKKILQRILEVGIPAELSLTAGSYLCNQITYMLLHTLHQQDRHISAGFIHLPYLPEQAAAISQAGKGAVPSMAMDTMVAAIEVAIQVLLEDSQT